MKGQGVAGVMVSRADDSPADEWLWGVCVDQLQELAGQCWSTVHRNVSPLQSTADLFFVRSSRRVAAVSLLFASWLYVEVATIIRNGLEDWITYAYLLSSSEPGRWSNFSDSLLSTNARVYEAFQSTYGDEATKRVFGELPPMTAKYVGKRPLKETRLRTKAKETSLQAVYDIAYPFLSAYCHPTTRPTHQLFEKEGRTWKARTPERDEYYETVLGMWEFWFELRILTLAGRAYGFDWEHLSDKFLTVPAKSVGFKTAVWVREHVGGGGG